MAFRKEFRLDIFKDSDFTKLENDALKFDDVAKRIEKAEQRLRTRGKLPRALERKQKKILESGFFGGREQDSALANKSKAKIKKIEESGDFVEDVLQRLGIRKRQKNLISLRGAPIQGANEFKKLQKQVAKNAIAVGAIQKVFGKLSPIIAGAGNPIAFGLGSIQSLASKLIPAGMIIAIAKIALDLWISSYGKGGSNDPRKPILDDVFSMIGIEAETDFMSASVLLVNSPSLHSGASARSNSENLSDGLRRTRLLDLGSGRV